MAGLVMLSFIILMVITLRTALAKRKGWKYFLQTLIGFFIVMGLFHFYVLKTCGPNAKDVELMKPQAEVITKYILENGIPKTMTEISNLPYKLRSCTHPITYREECSFTINNDSYRLTLYESSTLELWLLNIKTKTLLNHEFSKSDSHWDLIETRASNIKPLKFCYPFRIHI